MPAPPDPLALLDEAEVRALVAAALAASAAPETEVLFSHRVEATTRFAADGITQNVLESHGTLVVRALVGARTGRASTTSFTPAALAATARRALEAAAAAAEDPEALPLPGPQSYAAVEHFDPRALDETPDARADRVAAAVDQVRARGLRPAGAATSGAAVEAVASSSGLLAFHRESHARFAVTALADDASGWAEQLDRSPAGLAVDALTATAIDKCERGRGPQALEPGDYPVVLEPAAVADLLLFFGWCALSGLAFNEGRSFLSDRLGAQLFAPGFTLRDDFTDSLAPGPPFDGEGMPRSRITLVESGIARAVIHDRRTAKAAGTASTGHALPQPNGTGPVAQNLVLASGAVSREELIRSTERGVLVTRLHYTNVVDPKALLLTGMTRDGTFLIEHGRVTRPLQNLRFTDSAARAFAGIEAVGDDPRSLDTLFGGNYVSPSLKLTSFSFSSGTEF